MSVAAPAVRTEALTKRFGRVEALMGLDLQVERGEVLGYLGPNGSGKTTTIRLLLDLLRPSAGRAEVLGGAPGDPSVRARVGYLPGELRLDRRYRAADVFAFHGQLHGGHDRAWVDELCQRLRLDPSRPVGELSTGNRRKVGLITAFAARPDLLVLDEPTADLDPLLQQEFQRLARAAAAEGATVFLSSHALAQVEALADRVAILRAGRLVALASIEELRARARQRLDLLLAGPADAEAFARLRGVAQASVDGTLLRLVVEGGVEEVMRAAAPLGVRRVTTHDTNLEDVFLSYYREGDR